VYPEDCFLPADAAALKTAILKGIDSPAALEDLPRPVQVAVLNGLAFRYAEQSLGFWYPS
jgi:hypothetical protein